MPHSLTANFIYELPFGKGKKFFSDNKWLGAVFGGWQFSGIYTKQTGRIYGLGNWFYYGGDLRAIAKDTKDQTVSDWFNWQLFPGASRDYAFSCANPGLREVWEISHTATCAGICHIRIGQYHSPQLREWRTTRDTG